MISSCLNPILNSHPGEVSFPIGSMALTNPRPVPFLCLWTCISQGIKCPLVSTTGEICDAQEGEKAHTCLNNK